MHEVIHSLRLHRRLDYKKKKNVHEVIYHHSDMAQGKYYYWQMAQLIVANIRLHQGLELPTVASAQIPAHII